jgi:hypothetical protein
MAERYYKGLKSAPHSMLLASRDMWYLPLEIISKIEMHENQKQSLKRDISFEMKLDEW